MSFLFCNESHLSIRGHSASKSDIAGATLAHHEQDLVSLIVDGDCLRAGCCGPAPNGQ